MSRRRVAQQNRRSGTQSVSTAAFQISNVSQTSGTLDGGTVITVTAVGIVGTPTCTLGTVSSIGAMSFQVTVAAHAAGAVSWTATNGNGQTSGSQTYTYLAHPSYSAISPSHGPETLTTAGVTITVSGLPANNATGCPISVTFNGVAATAVAVTDSTHLTCTAPAGSVTTAVDVIVTVDTKSTTGTGVWTYDPPPSELSATNVGTSGGSGTITGINFVSTPTASALINGTPTSLTVAFVSSTQLTFTLAAGSYVAGAWDLTVTNPDGQSDVQPIFTISNIRTPAVIFGTDLKADWNADNAVLSGSNVTSIPDDSGNNNALAGGTSPTINLADTDFNSHKSIQFTAGSSTYLTKASFALGTAGTISVALPVKVTADPGTNAYLFDYSLTDFAAQFASTTHRLSAFYNGNLATNTTDVLNTKLNLVVSDVGTAGTSNALSISENNAADVTGSATATIPANSGTFDLGRRLTQYLTYKTPRVLVIARKASAGDQTDLVQYLQLTYKVTPSPTFTAMTKVGTAGGTGRISGTGFLSGVTVTAQTLGDLAAVFRLSTVLDVTVPAAAAGTYDITITNPDGNVLTISNGLTVTATDDDEMVILGTSVLGLYNAGLGVTTVGGVVSSWADQSGLGNTLSQATGANRPAYNATDANFNNQPTLSTTGSPINMSTSAFYPGGATGTHEGFLIAMARLTTNPASRGHLSEIAPTAGFSMVMRYESAGKPVGSLGIVSLIATWGSSQTNNTRMLATHHKTDGVNANVGVNVSNGTEVTNTTATASQATFTNPLNYYLFMRDNASEYFIGAAARVVLCSGLPSGAQLTRLASLYQSTYGSI